MKSYIFGTLSLICFFLMLGMSKNLWMGIFIIPFAIFLYLSGGCFDEFYGKEKRK